MNFYFYNSVPIGVFNESGERWAADRAAVKAAALPGSKLAVENFGVWSAAIWLTNGNGDCPFNGSPVKERKLIKIKSSL